jgi:hypothetical protein
MYGIVSRASTVKLSRVDGLLNTTMVLAARVSIAVRKECLRSIRTRCGE